MHLAVCLVCGTHKRGALVPCPACDWEPVAEEDRVRSLLVAEHHADEEDLDRVAEALRAGNDVVVPEVLVLQALGCEGQRRARPPAEPPPPRAPEGTPAAVAQADLAASLEALQALAHARHRYVHVIRHGRPLLDEVQRRALEQVRALGAAPHPTNAAWLARALCLPFAPHVGAAALHALGAPDDDPARAADALAGLPATWADRALAALEHLVEVVASGPSYPREVLEALRARSA